MHNGICASDINSKKLRACVGNTCRESSRQLVGDVVKHLGYGALRALAGQTFHEALGGSLKNYSI